MEHIDIESLITTYGKDVYRFCLRISENRDIADDLYQETFLKAFELNDKIDKSNNPKGFLIAVAAGIWKNNRRKYFRRQRIAPQQELNDEAANSSVCSYSDSPEEIVLSREQCMVVRTATDKLNDRLRIPLYMYYTAEMSVEDIAQALKIPKGTVKSRLHKARQNLRKVMEGF